MNDYNELFKKGSRYVMASGSIFNARKHKLISLWGNCNCEEYDRKKRIDRIIKSLECRIKEIMDRIHSIEKEQHRRKLELEIQYINLSCPCVSCKFDAAHVVAAIRYIDHEPGKLKCSKCGSTLVEENERGIDEMLFQMGLK